MSNKYEVNNSSIDGILAFDKTRRNSNSRNTKTFCLGCN